MKFWSPKAELWTPGKLFLSQGLILKRYLPVLRNYTCVGWISLGLALLASVLVVTGATAHALLLKSQPEAGATLVQSPLQVTAWFSQELDTGLSTLLVVNGDGQQVDNGDGGVDLNDPNHASLVVSLPPVLPAGLYTVQWTATSAEDGDPTTGQFSFIIGQVTAANNSRGTPWTGWLVGAIAASVGVLLIVVIFMAWKQSQSSPVS
jgi:copper transport protein